jgi:hypothetical protein
MLGIVKDYLAIARGTLAVGAGAVVAGGRSVVSAVTDRSNARELPGVSLCGPRSGSAGATEPPDLEPASAVPAEPGRLARLTGLAPQADLDAIRRRLSRIEGQLAHLHGSAAASGSEPVR